MGMPGGTTALFARDFINEIVLEVFDELKTHPKNGNYEKINCERGVDGYLSVTQSACALTFTREGETRPEYNEREATKVIEQMVRDLRATEIGDSSYVLTPSLSSYEHQQQQQQQQHQQQQQQMTPTCGYVGRTSIDPPETCSIRGEGDVEQNRGVTGEELESEKSESSNCCPRGGNENVATNGGTKIFVNFLYRAMKELQDIDEEKAPKAPSPKSAEKPVEEESSNAKEKRNSDWEEKEETLLRVIEQKEHSCENIAEECESLDEESSEGKEETKVTSPRELSSLMDIPLDEISNQKDRSPVITEIYINEDEAFSQEPRDKKKKKKKTFGMRLKKLFLGSFKHAKN